MSNQPSAIAITINGVLAAEYTALKGAPLTRLLLLYCLVGPEVANLGC